MPVSKFLKRFRFEELKQVVNHSFRRFPLSTIFVILSFILVITRIHEINLLSDEHLGRTILFLTQAALFSAAAQLFCESSAWGQGKRSALLLAGCAVLAASTWLPTYLTSMQAYITAALVLLFLFVPYILRKSTEDSIWYYNYLNLMTVLMAGVSALIFSLGLCAIVGSIEYLFEIHSISSKIYMDIWTTGWSFLFPVYLLAQLPPKFDFEKQECAVPKGISFIANYLAVPLSLTYTFILYAYFAKIMLQWQLPRGNLAYMVTGFGILGIGTYLAVYPMRETGTRLLQQFYKYFFAILIVPIILLALGIYTRISQYGLTEERYDLALCWIWFAGLSLLYTLWRRRAHIKYIPMLMCALLLIASCGPWSAESLSTASQINRLGEALAKAGVISKDGTFQKAVEKISFEDRKNISSIVDYLADHHSLRKIEVWTAPFHVIMGINVKNYLPCRLGLGCPHTENADDTKKILEAWGVQYVSRWQREDTPGRAGNYFHVDAPSLGANTLIKAAPYEYVADVSPNIFPYLSQKKWEDKQLYREGEKEIEAADFTLTTDGDFTIELNDKRKITFALQPLMDDLYKQNLTFIREDKNNLMILHKSENGLDATLRISGLHGSVMDGHVRIEGGRMIVLFTAAGKK